MLVAWNDAIQHSDVSAALMLDAYQLPSMGLESVMPSNTKSTVTRKPAAPMANGETQPLRGCVEDKPGILAHIFVTHLAQLPSEGKASAGALVW